MAGLEQVTPLGSLYAYNNAAFNVAGRILEIAGGQPYEQAIQELVLTPLGLSNSFFFPEDAGSRPVTRGHRVRNGEIVSAEPWTSSRALAPCGGLASSVSDLLRYAQFHCGNGTTPDGQRILTPGSLKTMQTPTIATEENGWMGLNWFIDDVDGTRFIRHCGQSNGQNSLYWMVPDRNFAFVLLVNLDPCGTIQSEMTNWVREHFLGIVTPEPRRMPITENQLNSYCGFYRLPPEEDPYELSRSGEDLILTQHTLQPTHWRLFCCAPDDFCMLDGPFEGRKLKFERGADQQVTLFRVDGRVSLKTP
jgi:hypothetical protein